MGLDDKLVNDELQRLAQAFAAGASAESPSLPLTALVIQVAYSYFRLKQEAFGFLIVC